MSFLCYIFVDLLGKEKRDIKINIALKLIRILFTLTRFFKSQLNGLSLTS